MSITMDSELAIQLPRLERITNLKINVIASRPTGSQLTIYLVSTPADLGDATYIALPASLNLVEADRAALQAAIKLNCCTGAAGGVQLVPSPTNASLTIGTAGVGSLATVKSRYLGTKLAEAGHKLGKAVLKTECTDLTLVVNDAATGLTSERRNLIVILLKSFMQALVPNDSYLGTKGKKKADATQALETLTLVVDNEDQVKPVQELADRARLIAEATRYAAALVDAPPSRCNCTRLADNVAQMIANRGLEIEILDEKEMAEMKMGSLLAVARGSKEARIIHLTYKSKDGEENNNRKVALVGKGITYDSGGYSMKSSENQLIMKCDMAGAATVLATGMLVAGLGIASLELHVVAVCCANLVSSTSYLVGDVITASNGKTIDVQNTDAEGRLALADGLVYAEKLLGGAGKGTILDIATLTGACMIALGTEIAGVVTTHEDLGEKLEASSAETGELVAQLPSYPKYAERLKSKIADIMNANMGHRYGGSITAALFLQEFVSKETKYAHIDAAGPLYGDEGGTGYGVYLLANLIEKHL